MTRGYPSVFCMTTPPSIGFQMVLINMKHFCLESTSITVQHMKYLIWFNEWVAMYVGIRLHPCFYIIRMFYIFIYKDMPIYFVSRKILLEAAQLQNWCISLSIRVYCTCTPHVECSKPRVSSWHASLMCRVCSLAIMHKPKLCATMHVHTNFLSFTCCKRADTYVYWHTCVKFKWWCTAIRHNIIIAHGCFNTE